MAKVYFGHQQNFDKLIFISSAQRVVLSKTVGIAKQSNRRNLPTQTVRLYCRRNGANILFGVCEFDLLLLWYFKQ